MTATPQASSPKRLGVNVFTAPAKAVVGERPRPFGEPLGWDPITSTLIYGEYDAVLVDTLTTIAEATALADWVALHHRNLTTIYVTHGHFDHFFGLSVLLNRFPGAWAIATPKSVQLMHEQLESGPLDGFFRRWWPGQLSPQMTTAEPYEDDTFTLEGHELHIIVLNGTPSCSLHPWIADHLGDDLSVPVMAASTAMSVRNFSRRFAQELGSTPAAYVEAVRVEAGRRLLETTRRGPTDTARDCGFGTVETMHRSFQRTVRVAPGRNRQHFSPRTPA